MAHDRAFRSNSFGISATIAFAFVMPNSRYFNGKETGVGIRIKNVSRLKEAVTPTQLGIQGAIPQNFKFLEKGIITKLERNLI
ncbi:hypothetical protein LEP1GSC074_3011 [Leptospira noguchii str. Hook]|nr:hypothetical protein LEP1GSC074_3011 [Leptospira noguchii str. Hook]